LEEVESEVYLGLDLDSTTYFFFSSFLSSSSSFFFSWISFISSSLVFLIWPLLGVFSLSLAELVFLELELADEEAVVFLSVSPIIAHSSPLIYF
jgi:hypothetical protein